MVPYRILGILLMMRLRHYIPKYSVPESTNRLGKYRIDPESLTVSGISSGGEMAVQLHFIFSSEVKGVGVFAGGPFACGEDLLSAFQCMQNPERQNIYEMNKRAIYLSQKGKIDPTENINGSRAFVFSGAKDEVVVAGTGRNLQKQYEFFGADVKGVFDIPAAHGMPVDNAYGGPCSSRNKDDGFLNNCGYNGMFEMIQWLYGEKNIRKPEKTFVADGKLELFDQREFIVTPQLASMSKTGLVYIPKNCGAEKNVTCKLHVVLHGCLSNMQYEWKSYALRTGILEVAELNDIIVLFPQTKASFNNIVGCFDWIGFSGLNYGTRYGLQPRTIQNMWRRIMS